jgi:glyoxylase-like metal-dependent hydrolase (beta-lactamase superfamily II)/8-oxo-dGTP pyrophosphatase MutT (NUDIX family)
VLLSLGPGSLDVFAIRRGAQLKFFGGFWAFPGGRLDADDLAIAGAAEPTVDALRITACRELLEEAGVLIARRPDGSFLQSGDDLDRLRRDLLDGRLLFAQLLAEQRLTVQSDDFRHIGQLTTPPFAQVRFATTFFTAYLPPGQHASVWPGELEEGRWASAEALVGSWYQGEGFLTPPAVTILQALWRQPIDEAPERLGPIFTGRAGDVLPKIMFAPDVQAIPLRTAALPPATHTNAFLVGPYLIDPGPTDTNEQKLLLDLLDERRRQNQRIHAILLTHHHPDHVGAAALCARHCGVPIWAHPLTAERLPGGLPVDRLLHDGDRIDLGFHPREVFDSWHLEVLHTPGHAPGHLAFFEPCYGLLFAGDMVSTQTSIVIGPPEGDLAVYLDSLRRLRALPARLLLPAHGNVSAQPQRVIDEAIAHRAKREAQLLEALAAGPATIDELTPQLYRGVPEALWRFARAQLLAGLLKLENERRARRAGEERWELC